MHSARRATVLVVLLLACFAAAVAARDADAGADTLVVDRADDSLTTACTSAANDCTFRGAMNRAYTTPASVARIEFRIPLAGTQIITTLTPLDVIGGPLEIDGTTQAEVDASCTVDEDGQPCIVLDGAGQGNHGIIGGTGSELTIRGLSIIRFGRAIWFPAGGNHVVVGNYLGTLDGSNFSLANGNETGVYVDTGIHDVRIGGPTALERNVISANDYGIVTNEGDLNIVVQGNYIGTTADGSTALGNRGAGVTFYKTTESLIGGDAAGEGNVISANGFTLDSSGILILNSTDIDVQGNLIGTNAAGTAALGNKTAGVVVAAGSIRTTIGGSGSAGNLISGNASSGIRLDSAGDDSFVRGNRIGTNVAGNAAIPNMGSGVVILNIPGADIGGHLPENGNLISGNGSDGIEIGGLNQGIFIYRNYIGVTADGESALGNADYGISEFATGTATDTTDIVDNVISANGVDGIHLFVSNLIFGSDLTNQVIAGNMVGTDASGSDPLHNGRDAIAIQGVAGAGIYSNTISVADGNRGIFLSSATGSFVQQNYVGTNAAGDDLNGGSVGIKVAQGANNHIGGLSLNPTAMGLGAAAGGNTIRNADTYGVHIEDPGSVGNTISGNSINDNGSLGIYLSNFGNGQEPAPVLASAVAGSTHVTGSLQSTPNQTFTIEFFSSPACDDSGAGEGQDYLGSATANTNPAGLAVIDATLTTDAPGGSAVTATSTDPTGNTSQFSNCVTMVGPTPTPSPTPSPTPTPTPSGSVTPTPSGAPLLGDGDCDGEVDLDDVIAALSEFGGVDPGADCADLADVDCDDDVDGEDALRILLFVAGTPMTPVVGCGQVGT